MYLEPFQRLEARALFAVDVILTARGTLHVDGSDGPDAITVRQSGAQIVVDANGAQVGTFNRTQVERLAILGNGGGDLIRNKTALRSSIEGGSGMDTVWGGRREDRTAGGDGADVLYWSAGHDSLDGGAGDNTMDFSMAPSGLLFAPGASEYDPLFTAPTPVFVGVDSIPQDFSLPTSGERDVLAGNSFSFIKGSAFDDSFANHDAPSGSLSSATTIYGGDGDDVFLAVDASIIGFGESGNDFFGSTGEFGGGLTAFGGTGDDTLAADPFDHTFDLGDGSNWLSVSPEYHQPVSLIGTGIQNAYGVQSAMGQPMTFIGDEGANIILWELPDIGNPANEPLPVTIEGGGGNDWIEGSPAGNDVIDGGAGNDTIRGAGGDDSLDGADGDDLVRGGEGNDTLIGGGGRDKLYGDAGDDLLLGRGGSKDRLDGGDGDDTASADAGPDVFDLIFNVESVN